MTRTIFLIACLLFVLSSVGLSGEGAPDLKTLFPKAADLDPKMEADEYAEYAGMALFDYIDGGADVYIDLHFIKVGAVEYIIELEEETYFTLDIYDMTAPVNAFGIYAAERYLDVPKADIGVGGRLGGGTLNFWTGRYYVKIRADDENETINNLLLKMGRYVAEKVGYKGSWPKELCLFPEKYKVKYSEKYAAKNLMGVKTLKGFSCKYAHKKDKMALLFAEYKDEKAAREAEEQFKKRLKSKPELTKSQGIKFDDKYLGRGGLFRVGSCLALYKSDPKQTKQEAWKGEVVKAFFDNVTKAACKKKADIGLKSLKGHVKGEEDSGDK